MVVHTVQAASFRIYPFYLKPNPTRRPQRTTGGGRFHPDKHPIVISSTWGVPSQIATASSEPVARKRLR